MKFVEVSNFTVTTVADLHSCRVGKFNKINFVQHERIYAQNVVRLSEMSKGKSNYCSQIDLNQAFPGGYNLVEIFATHKNGHYFLGKSDTRLAKSIFLSAIAPTSGLTVLAGS